MIEQLGTAITFHAFFVASGVGATGLTVTVEVYEGTTGTPIVTGASATEMGDGLYYYTLASGSVDAEGAYTAVFQTVGTADQKHLAAQWQVQVAGVENLDAAVSGANTTTPPTAAVIADTVWDEANAGHIAAGTTGKNLSDMAARSGSGTEVISSPITTTSNVTLFIGDDYNDTDSRSIEWTDSDGVLPSFTSATPLAFNAQGLSFASTFTIVDANTIRLELTAAQTATLKPVSSRYYLVTTLASGRIVTVATGFLTVIDPAKTPNL